MTRFTAGAILLAALVCLVSISAISQLDARMMRWPDVSQTQIVFSYAGDLWLVAKDGGTATRLSSPKGEELYAKFSPDGKTIAYSANYDGNPDVYTVAVTGGLPARLTNHGYSDRVVGWAPDGKRVLFASAMASGRQRFNQFYTVGVEGGLPQQLPLPYAEIGCFSPDGKKIAYTYVTQAFRTWKRYRGGWAPDIHVFDLDKKTDENITLNDASDEFPMWTGNTIYFLSDRGAEQRSNLWMYDVATKQVRQLTSFTDFDVHFPSLGPSEIVFEAGGKLYLFDLKTEKYRDVQVKVVTDEMTLLPKRENVSRHISTFAVSPDGKRGVFEARGDIFSVPAENGPVFNLTRTSGAAERYPAWSPDGKTIAYWSDESGEYELMLKDVQKGTAKKVTSYGPGYRYQLAWSPDSKKIAFIDKAMAIRYYDIEENRTVDVDKAKFWYEGNLAGFSVSWSPDSRWIAYGRDLDNQAGAVFLFDTQEETATQVTSGYYNDNSPSFDPDGKYLYYTTNRSLNPVYSDYDGTWIYPNTTVIAAVPLTPDIASPLAPKNDTLTVGAKDAKKEEKKDDEKKGDKDAKGKETKIVLNGFESRAVLLPPAAGNIAAVHGVAGKVLFYRSPNTGSADKKRSLMYYDLDKREEKTIVDDLDAFDLSADGKKILVKKGDTYAVVDVAEGQKLDKRMPSGTLESTIDPRAEWKQIFTDAWRIERDFFYDANMHGVDWKAMKTRYGALIDACVTRWDVNYVIGELIAELNASHTYRGGGELEQPLQRPIGYLGVDWAVENGAFRVKKIISGAAWDAEARSPLAASGVNVKEGDYILAVNGVPMDVARAPWIAFEGQADQAVELTVNSRPSMDGSRKVVVKTMADEERLRNLAWIEASRRRVDEASGGKIGYIYVPSTGIDGQTELVRQFYAQFMKEGLIIDERFNSGGQIPDRFIELLNRKPLAFWAVRDGKTWQHPVVGNFGPKAMLINGWSGSGGDAFPDYFRKAGLGPLIGSRTWGGLIGITGNPALIDGGTITVPTFRMYNPDGTWFKEGHGVDPDIAVPEDPGQLARGTDVQLERAIQEVVKQLKDHPVKLPPDHQPYERR
jgi:tricorn protease